MIAEIHKIDPGSLIFQNVKNPNSKNLDLQAKIHFAQKRFFWEITDFTDANF